MFYGGHGSWVPVAVFAALFALRLLGSRRRGMGGRGPMAGRPFTGPGAARRPDPPPPPPTGPVSEPTGRGTGVPAGWFRDPFFRHEQRYWSGTAWSEHVTDDGVPAIDPPPPTAGPSDRS